MIATLKRDSIKASTRNNGKQSTSDRTADVGRHRRDEDGLSRRSPNNLVDSLQDMRISRTNTRDGQLDAQEFRYTSVRQHLPPFGTFRVNERLRVLERPILHTGWM
jgi:hypothetical protein